jgi:hypothetical protein
MRSEQARSTEAAPTPSTWIGKVDLNASVARMVHRLVPTVGGTGIGGLGDPFLAAAPLPVNSSARPGEPGSIVCRRPPPLRSRSSLLGDVAPAAARDDEATTPDGKRMG